MDYLKQVATVEDITEELNKVVEEEIKFERLILFNLTGNQEFYDLTDSADAVKSSVVEYNRIAKDLCTVGNSVNETTKEIMKISKEMDACSSDAVSASKNIKHYNTLKVNAEKALELVTAMIDLNRSVAGIEHSLENEEYEKATDYIVKYRHAILTGDISNKDMSTMEKSTNTLINALLEQLNINIEKNKPVQVYRYCHLLDSLGEGRSALSKLVPFLLKPLQEQIDKDVQLLRNQRSSLNIGVVVSNILGGLFKKAVDLVEEVQEQVQTTFVNEHFGFCYLLQSIYIMCDKQCSEIISMYYQIRDIAVLIENTKQILQQYITAEEGKENQQLGSINQVLNEFSLFLQHHESFQRFFVGRGNDAYFVASRVIPAVELKDYQSKFVLPEELVNSMTLIQQKKVIPQGNQAPSFKSLQQLSHGYTTLEECFALYSLNQSFFKCVIEQDSYCTSIPEEAFYLFEIIITRAISQGNIRNISTILSIVKGLIEQYLHAHVLSLIRGRKSLPSPSINISIPKDQFSIVVIMNDISLTIDFLNKLNSRVIQNVIEVFPQVPANIRKSTDDITNSCILLFKNSYELQMRKLKDTILTPLCQKIEKKIITTNFSILNDVQSEQTADDLLDAVINMINNTLLPYKQYVFEDTFTALLNDVSLQLSNRLDTSLIKLKYSQQGVLILDKVVRGVSNELITHGGSEIRTNFSKINKLIAILSCDDVSSAMALVLNDKDDMSKDHVKTILKQRIDL